MSRNRKAQKRNPHSQVPPRRVLSPEERILREIRGCGHIGRCPRQLISDVSAPVESARKQARKILRRYERRLIAVRNEYGRLVPGPNFPDEL